MGNCQVTFLAGITALSLDERATAELGARLQAALRAEAERFAEEWVVGIDTRSSCEGEAELKARIFAYGPKAKKGPSS